MKDSLVIIPTFNEKENIEHMLDTVMGLSVPFDVLVVDDGSPDGTANLVRIAQDKYPGRVHLHERSGKLGLGTAYIAGFRWGLARAEYEFLFEMDCDFSHDPNDLLRLRQACLEGADLGIGSRYVRGGSVKDWPWTRILISRGASIYTSTVLSIGIKDSTSGFKCYRRKVLETINLDNITFVGYAFQIAMKYAVKRAGFVVKEVPITFIDRVKGTSKMSIGIFKEAFLGVWKMRFSKNF